MDFKNGCITVDQSPNVCELVSLFVKDDDIIDAAFCSGFCKAHAFKCCPCFVLIILQL